MSTQDSTSLATIAVPGGASIIGTTVDGKPVAILHPLATSLGLDYSSQLAKLKGKSWATMVKIATVGADGKNREMVGIDRRTLTMYLATLDEKRIKEEVRPTLIALQAEAADALDAYFHDGGAINPSATEDQLATIIGRAEGQARVLSALRGIVDPKHLEAKGRIVLARALGEAPELNPADVPLYVSDFLKAKGLASDLIQAKSSGFGKRLKGAYLEAHGKEPRKAHQELPNGTIREVNAYTEADRHLFEQVWVRHYAQVVSA